MTEQEQIDALKAQVNLLRKGLALALVKVTDDDNDIEFMDVYGYLNKAPEQCLAEVKAKAIESAGNLCYRSDGTCLVSDLHDIAKEIREQAK